MSEEKPTFKVTDRRLFNPDGTPREDVAREEPAPAPAPPPQPAAQPAAPEPQSQPARGSGVSEGAAADSPQRGANERPAERTAAPSSRGASQPPEAADPTAFANLVMFIASPAAAAMGMTEHPGLAPGELDLPLAKHCIDLLATVREKTRGNLSAQENEIVESLLAELRMQYVSLTNTRPAPPPPRGFTGGDITGGR